MEIDDLDESPAMAFDADEAMQDSDSQLETGPSDVERMQALLMKQFFEGKLHQNDQLAKAILR